MTAGIRRARDPMNIDRLLAVGGSLAVHGMAVAALIAFADGKPENAASPAVLTMALEWSAPSSEAAAENSAGPDQMPVTDATDSFTPQRDQAAAQEVKPETPAAGTDGDMPAGPATTAQHRADGTPIPSGVEATVKPKATALSRAAVTASTLEAVEHASGELPGESQPNAARDSAVAAVMPAIHGGERSAWSITSRQPPAYPMAARRRGIEGDVSLRVDVGADGRPRKVTIQHGSGDPQLDAAAMRAVEQWRFAVAAPMTIEIPIVFRLNTDTAEATQP